jgi:hypothetical protein
VAESTALKTTIVDMTAFAPLDPVAAVRNSPSNANIKQLQKKPRN